MSIATPGPTVQAAARPAAADAAPAAPTTYVGLVTRALAFGIDAAVINVVAIVTAAVVALTFSVVNVPDDVEKIAAAAGGVAYLLWSVGYFVTFWATTGQTPGSRAFRIQVRSTTGGRLPPRRALVRFAGLTLAAIPLGAGFLIILVDDRRRGLQDWLARTVVVDAEPAAPRRSRAAP